MVETIIFSTTKSILWCFLSFLIKQDNGESMPKPKEYFFKEGCFIEEWHNSEADKDCSIAHVRVEPGSTTKLHALRNTVERYVILKGKARVTVGTKQWEISDGDVVVIQANEKQKITNLTKDDLLFLAICTPRFEVSNYYECEEKAK